MCWHIAFLWYVYDILIFRHIHFRFVLGSVLEAILARFRIYFWSFGLSKVNVTKISPNFDAKTGIKKVGPEDVRVRNNPLGWWPGAGIRGEVNLLPGGRRFGRKEKEERNKGTSWDFKKGEVFYTPGPEGSADSLVVRFRPPDNKNVVLRFRYQKQFASYFSS